MKIQRSILILPSLAALFMGQSAALAYLTARPTISPQQITTVGTPLPLTCTGPAICLYGYVYFGDTPVAGASVHIDAPLGTVDVSSATGALSAAPYFTVNLTGAPLLVAVGDTITLTANHNGSTATTAYVVAPSGQQVDIVIPASPLFGDGRDGNLTVNGTVDLNPVRATASGISGSSVLTISGVTGDGFEADQLVMIHQTRGANAGVWEMRQVQVASATQLTLTSPLSNTYQTDAGASRAQVLWVPQYNNVTINLGASVMPTAWNDSTGGIIAFLGRGALLVSGTISANGSAGFGTNGTGAGYVQGGGFHGGGAFRIGSGTSFQGEGTGGAGSQTTTANGNGAGGGHNAGANRGGSGGGNGTQGLTGTGTGTAGMPGNTAGSSFLDTMVFGGAGSGGAAENNNSDQLFGAGGGNGGGIVIISSNIITLTGAISAIGGTGGNGEGASGGGGAGGSILMSGRSIALGSNLVAASGGAGGSHGIGLGGDGGAGRIHVRYGSDSSAWTTNPPASTQQLIFPTGPIPTIHFIHPYPEAGLMDTLILNGSAATHDLSGAAITTYVWRSDLDGVLSTVPSFTRTAASLTPGVHTIYFKARDSNNVWSEEISRTLTILTQPNYSVFLPNVLDAYQSAFVGPNEAKDNDTLAQANGPLQSATNYFGFPNDFNDYFSFYTSGGSLAVALTNDSGQGTQLFLYYQSTASQAGFAGGPPYQINLSGRPPGWYYVRVYTAGNFNSVTPYTLRVTFP